VHLRAELDFVEEANNTELVARVLADYEDLVVPKVIRQYVTEKVLVLERIEGRKVDADHGLAAERARDLARQFFRAYVHQVTVEGVYHADPHRGNVLLTTDGRLALVDLRVARAARRRYSSQPRAPPPRRRPESCRRCRRPDLRALAHDARFGRARFHPGSAAQAAPRYHWRPLSGIRAGEALADLQRISFEYGIALPTSFALVGEALAQADSIARVLHPELDPSSCSRRTRWR
jgi:predicted unusual protein kinase regulating ubiquinone biosynthesis (AarF/ABC1/UbiB family)